MQSIPEQVKFDFGFGEAVCVREVLSDFCNLNMSASSVLSLSDMGYPGPGPGMEDLVSVTKDLLEWQITSRYEHVIITAGATMGVILSLKALKECGSKLLAFRKPYFFHYPSFASKSGLDYVNYVDDMMVDQPYDTALVDSPTNPDGKTPCRQFNAGTRVLWDATYYNEVFCKIKVKPDHNVMVGSFGKLFGITGVRLGWVATDNGILAEKITKLNYENTLGVSVPSQRIVHNILSTVDLQMFTKTAAHRVDDNREAMTKLEYLSSDNSTVPVSGMFFWTRMDEDARALLRRCGVTYTDGSFCGGSKDHVRLNLAQSNKLTADMVKHVRRIDGKR